MKSDVIAPPEDFNLGDFMAKLFEYQTQMVFDEKSGGNWPEYRDRLMNEYRGIDMLKAYADQIRAAGIEVENYK